MKLIKTLGLSIIIGAFFVGITVTSNYAQSSRTRWDRNQGNQRSWNRSNNNRWNRNQSWRSRQNGRISSREYYRLQRQRARIYNSRSRYYRDGNLNSRERNRLGRQYQQYRRNVYRARRY